MAEEPREIENIISPAQVDKLRSAIFNDRLDTFCQIFKRNKLRPNDTIRMNGEEQDGVSLLFIAAGCGDEYMHVKYYSKHIVEYLVENGADINAMSKLTNASTYSREFQSDDRVGDVMDVYTTVLMNLAIKGRVAAMKYFIKHGADVNAEAITEEDINTGETAADLCLNAINELDDSIKRMGDRQLSYFGSQYVKKRNDAVRGYEFLKGIDIRERVKEPFSSTKNYGRANYVFQSAPGVGPLEKKYMLKFLRKPATFKMPRNHGLKRINTDLFKGGSTRRRRRIRKN